MNRFAIYVHVPWCRRRCPYCDFYFVVGRPEPRFFDAIVSEWEGRRHLYVNKPAESLYFGGGTPSLLAPEMFQKLAEFFVSDGGLDQGAEITIEANPEDIDEDFALRLARTPVNRISLGIQSFDDQVLKSLGRKHDSARAKKAIGFLQQAGFGNISIDLILGVNHEDIGNIERSLYYLIGLKIPHISTYLLTIEEGTKFSNLIRAGHMKDIDEDAQVEAYRMAQRILNSAGYVQYDISSFGQPHYFSQHNQVYWAGGHYLGLGPKAHSMRLLPDGGAERAENSVDVMTWLNGHITRTAELLSPKEALRESLAFGLRNMKSGIRPSELEGRHQAIIPEGFFNALKGPKDRGWLDMQGQSIKINSTGALFADSIMRDILLT